MQNSKTAQFNNKLALAEKMSITRGRKEKIGNTVACIADLCIILLKVLINY
jgi:hypothetical protein